MFQLVSINLSLVDFDADIHIGDEGNVVLKIGGGCQGTAPCEVMSECELIGAGPEHCSPVCPDLRLSFLVHCTRPLIVAWSALRVASSGLWSRLP